MKLIRRNEAMLKSVSKKLLSGVLALAMVLTLVAVPAVDAQAAIKSNGYKLTDRTSVTAGAKSVAYKVTGVKKGTKVTVLVSSGVYVGKTRTATADGARKITLTGTGKTLTFYVKVPETYTKTKANVKVTVAKTSSTAKTVLKDSVNIIATSDDDLSGVITLTDTDGLQADGTALPTDTLEVTYGSTLGTPKTIIWYCNGAAKGVYTTDGGNLSAGFNNKNILNSSANSAMSTGVWYVSIENTAGNTYTTQSITVTETGVAVVSGLAFTDDYETEDGEYLTYDADDATAVASVTLNKDYTGKFYIYTADTTSYTTNNAVAVVNLANVYNATSNATGISIYEQSKSSYMTEANVIADTIYADEHGYNALYKYTDSSTGAVTYMFVPATYTDEDITRGTSYVVVFDQADIDTDDITTKATTTVNATSAATVPYLTAPESIAVTSFDKSTGAVKVSLYDGSGDVITSYTDNGTDVKALFSSIYVYNPASSEVSSSDTTVSTIVSATEKGVMTLTTGATTNDYVYAKLKTVKGVFGSTAVTLTSDVYEVKTAAAASVVVTESKSDAADAVIKFTSLKSKASGTVYLLQGDSDNDDATEIAAKKVSTAIASATVSGGASSVTLDDVFSEAQIKAYATNKNDFVAVFVPDDTDLWAPVASEMFTLAQTATSYTLNAPIANLSVVSEQAIWNVSGNATTDDEVGTAYATADLMVTLDQFGEIMSTSDTTSNTDVNATWALSGKTSTSTGTITVQLINSNIADDADPTAYYSAIVITKTDTSTYGAWVGTMDDGSTMTVMITPDGTTLTIE